MLGSAGREMRRSDFTKAGKFAAVRRMVIFNFAAVVGFLLGTAGFTASMFMFPNPTFAWLFGNCIGGLSHFSANYIMQGQSKKEITKCFIVFNATGIIGFLAASGIFALARFLAVEPNASWLFGSMVGTTTHYVLNNEGMKLNFDVKIPKKPKTPR